MVFDVRFTARPTGLAKQAAAELADALNAMALADSRKGRAALFSLRRRFPTEWFRFQTVADPVTGDHTQSIPVTADLFPFYVRSQKVKIRAAHVIAIPKGASLPVFDAYLTPAGAAPNPAKDKITVPPDPTLKNASRGAQTWLPGAEQGLGNWTLRILAADYAAAGSACDDILLMFEYVVG